MSHEDELKQAVALIKSGDKAGGAKILKTILKANRDNERAWMWMSACVETDDDRIYCLREALRINPQNENARKALEKLQPGGVDMPARQPAHSPIASQPIPQRATSQPVVSQPAPSQPVAAQPVATTQPPPVAAPVQRPPSSGGMSKTTKIVLMVLGILVGLCLICGGIGWYLYDQSVKTLENISSIADKDFLVEYEVTGQAQNVNIVYSTPDLGTEDQLVKKLPWSKKYTMKGATRARLTITNSAAGGFVSCEIRVNGNPVDTQVTNEADGELSCSTTVGVIIP